MSWLPTANSCPSGLNFMAWTHRLDGLRMLHTGYKSSAITICTDPVVYISNTHNFTVETRAKEAKTPRTTDADRS